MSFLLIIELKSMLKYTQKSLLTLWCMLGIPVMQYDAQNAEHPFNTLCVALM